ncbi:uncharacterized protein LOC110018218 [Phalaenopsis equestris]|uniref:uncharacterized protein LOC110018218 n=1 Tax=Phalaenopsis equestris TaxID=78828 RepID=UPI0009E2B9BC|nr:uncharacterized protein LOC110018218 [Phalaenopsis equestris]
MAEKFEEGDSWLPAEFLGEGFFLEERRAAALMPGSEKRNGLVRENASLSYPNMVMETESDEEDYVAGLTRKMARSFLVEDSTSSFWDTRVLATSPQSTLCDAGIWSASSTGSQKVCSKASPPLSAFLEQRKEDAMDLFYAAAGEVLRNKQNQRRASERYQRKNLLVDINPSAIAGSHSNQVERQRIQAAQFYRLKQQQLVKQQLSSTWTRQNRAAAATTTSVRSHGLASSPWSPLPQQQQQPSSGMRALFLNSTGARRESAGTGVFLPRRAGSPTAKKPACSTVLLPARVVQALNLTLDDAGIQPRFPAHISRDHETATVRINPGNTEQKRNIYQLPQTSISRHDIQLPKEWTY